MTASKPQRLYDFIVLGAGPAGLQLAYYLAQQGWRFLVLEAGSGPGTFFSRFPRHGRLISINKVYTGYRDREINLRWDWNSLLSDDGPLFAEVSEAYFPTQNSMIEYLQRYSDRFGFPIRFDTQVEQISKVGGNFVLRDAADERYQCQRLVVATGVSQPRTPVIPGIELGESYATMSTDPREFTNQRVLIVGKGNSAFETADNLVGTAAAIHMVSPTPLQMAWGTHFVGHLRAVNNNFLDTYQLKSQNAVLDAEIVDARRIEGKIEVTSRFTHAHDEVETLRYDRMLICAGFQFDRTIFDHSCTPELCHGGKLPAQTSSWESTNVEGLFFAGALMQARDFHKQMSAFIHGFRYNVRALARIFAVRYRDQPWPHRALGAGQIGDAILDRINVSSALWQQPGFLCDLVSFEEGSAMYREDLPADYIRDVAIPGDRRYLTISLEFGASHCRDPFHHQRIHRLDVKRANQSTFLHPVIRHYVGHEIAAEHHIIEDLAAEWREHEHVAPLREFLATLS